MLPSQSPLLQPPNVQAELLLGQPLSWGFAVTPLLASTSYLTVICDQACGQQWWSMCECSRERCCEEQVRKHKRVRGRKEQRPRNEKQAALARVWEEVIMASCLIFTLSDWAVLSAFWLYKVPLHCSII